ncbi:MAG: TraB/GumN family protein [Verrucomicrobiota bacterium]
MLRFLLVSLLLVTSLSAQSSVWKISRGANSLYLAGTLHMLRPADFPLPAEFDHAFAVSKKLFFETDISRLQSSAEMLGVITTQGMYTDGTSLEKVLTPEAWKAVQEYCAKSGLPLEQLRHMKPWLFTITMAMVELQKLGISSQGVDIHYFNKTAEAGKSTGELETFERHLQHLVNLGAGHESEMIAKTIEDLAELPGILEKLIAAWRIGDLKKIDTLMLEDTRKKYPAVFKDLLVDRNNAWLPRIEALIKTSEVELILVGAGHLAGPEGLIALLKAKGYTIEQVDLANAKKSPKS